ncbi:MAG: hypothetical protein ACREFY_21415, partial [Acetobacteraceae bacterium]
CYPMKLGGDEAFIMRELDRLGAPAGYIENGPVARHNDWPYSEAKIALYSRLTQERAVTDLPWLRWKLRRLLGRAVVSSPPTFAAFAANVGDKRATENKGLVPRSWPLIIGTFVRIGTLAAGAERAARPAG